MRPFPNVEDAEYKITTDGGTSPLWAHNGRELFYWKESGDLVSVMAVPISAGQALDFGAPNRSRRAATHVRFGILSMTSRQIAGSF